MMTMAETAQCTYLGNCKCTDCVAERGEEVTPTTKTATPIATTRPVASSRPTAAAPAFVRKASKKVDLSKIEKRELLEFPSVESTPVKGRIASEAGGLDKHDLVVEVEVVEPAPAAPSAAAPARVAKEASGDSNTPAAVSPADVNVASPAPTHTTPVEEASAPANPSGEADSNAPLRSGYLQRRKMSAGCFGKRTSLEKTWVQLSSSELQMKPNKDSRIYDQLEIAAAVAVEVEGKDKKTIAISDRQGRIHRYQSASAEDAKQWADAIQKAKRLSQSNFLLEREILHVSIEKTAEGMGLQLDLDCLRGYVVIVAVVEGRAGGVLADDVLLEINGKSLEGISQQEALTTMRSIGEGAVALKLARKRTEALPSLADLQSSPAAAPAQETAAEPEKTAEEATKVAEREERLRKMRAKRLERKQSRQAEVLDALRIIDTLDEDYMG